MSFAKRGVSSALCGIKVLRLRSCACSSVIAAACAAWVWCERGHGLDDHLVV
jgi:hypothetical protein